MRSRTALRLLKKIPPVVAAYYPPAGECWLCGFPDKRHRMFDALAAPIHAGNETPERVAREFDIPLPVVRAVAKWWREGK